MKPPNTPKLRFKEFTDNWQVNKLRELCEMKAGKFVPANQIHSSSSADSYICYGANGARGYVNDFSHEGSYSLIGRQGALCGNVTYVSGKFYATEHAIVVHPTSTTDSKWLYYQLRRMNLNKLATGQAQPGLSVDTIYAVRQMNPSHDEQEKIAGFLTVVDERIELAEKKVGLLKQYKKGMMQKIFTQQLIFKSNDSKLFPPWHTYKLGEVGEAYAGLSGKSGEDFGSGSNFITYMQVFSTPKIDPQGFAKVKISVNERQNTVQRGDIFFTTSSETPKEVGYASVLLDEAPNTYLNSFCFGYRTDSNLLSSNFARYFFHSPIMRREISRLAQGSTRFNLSKNSLMKVAAMLPNIKEQQRIADFLTCLDDKIKLEEKKLTRAQNFKKFLLQRMFI